MTPWCTRYAPEVYDSSAFRRVVAFVRSAAFANAFAAILVANTCMLLLEVQGEPLYDRTLLITGVFVAVYSLELGLLVLVRGWTWCGPPQRSAAPPSLVTPFSCLLLLLGSNSRFDRGKKV